MKAHLVYQNFYNVRSLYPTWFRWKAGDRVIRDAVVGLYIPHGSDESFLAFILSPNKIKIFISHMVQMKGSFRK